MRGTRDILAPAGMAETDAERLPTISQTCTPFRHLPQSRRFPCIALKTTRIYLHLAGSVFRGEAAALERRMLGTPEPHVS
jgi:hypothetical protein